MGTYNGRAGLSVPCLCRLLISSGVHLAGQQGTGKATGCCWEERVQRHILLGLPGRYSRLHSKIHESLTGIPAEHVLLPCLAGAGYDMEDAMILNKSAVERGFAHASLYKVETVNLREERGK